ncbi:MAG: glycosyl hydrolase family 18 protein [Peptostreptococcaceae bacterium]
MKFKSIKRAMSLITALSIVLSPAGSSTSFANSKEKSAVENTQSTDKDLERKIVGYFPEWAYKSKEHNYFDVTDLQWNDLTHIQYSFAMVDEKTNQIAFGDKFAAIEEDFSEHEMSYNGEKVIIDEKLPYKGHFNILNQMKKKNPDVDLLISVGGWAGSRGFYTMMDTDQGIDTFTDSCVDFIRTYGFDGVDIDFEFPSSTSQSGNPADFDLSEPRRKTINARYNLMMKTLREKIDKASKEDGKDYLLTAAVSASSWVLGGVDSNEYASYLDFLSIMSYDYHGGWNQFVENQANIYPDPADKETAGMIMPVLGMDWSYKYYRGVLPPEKILMGIPYYTRGWENVQGGNGTGLHGTSNTPATGKYNIWGDPDENGGIIPAGANPLWHVLNLMEQDSELKVHWDEVGKVPYIWHNNEKVFLTFENEQSIDERLKYIEEKNLGGALIWVMDGDFGLNPNHVEGSTDINEGKYTYGNTLTERLSNGLDKMGPAKETTEGNSGLEKIDVDVELKGNYDHPNYTYEFIIKNNTGEKINGGWELAFDLPKSAVFKSTWGGTFTSKDNGDFNRITLKSSGWQNLEPGATTNLQGMIGLCFSGVKNITFNGKSVSGDEGVNPGPEENAAPVINGATNKTINIGDRFDELLGVTATDKEDGDLTSSIKVSGNVETNKAGNYTLTYSVVDSKGLATNVTRIITVKDNTPQPEPNTSPILNGVVDKTINVGDRFDKMSGITATDKEDGDLTSAIKVTGNLDTDKAGSYTLTYSVSDSKGLTTSKSRTITVKSTSEEGDTYDATKTYLQGDTVVYKGDTYKAKWWVQGEAPDKSAAWEKVVAPNEDGSINYEAGMVFNGGETVKYQGKIYKAKWWTNTVPGSDSSWELVG